MENGIKTETFITTKKLRQIVISLEKAHSSFFYFTMEANDNIAFYSTLPGEKTSGIRQVKITVTPELSSHMDSIFEHFKTRYPLEIISDEMITDSL
jgi:hypothetical protein